jgi:hypothetical protein
MKDFCGVFHLHIAVIKHSVAKAVTNCEKTNLRLCVRDRAYCLGTILVIASC